ncbi:MAG TPA: hypothetical protein VMW42_02100 [Desulfatiglandales bacterium]|nr:hypothetical protein [Desulfatiglandales bacterium]
MTEIEKLRLALSLAESVIDPDVETGMTYKTGKMMAGIELGGVKSISVRKVIQNALENKDDIFEGATIKILKGPDKK